MHALVLATFALLGSIAEGVSISDDDLHPNPVEATEFSLIYGSPLLSYTKASLKTLAETNATNLFYHKRKLSTPDDTSVVLPNDDTLYSSAVLDLSQHDVVLQVPAVDEHYWAFSFYDVYGDNYANIGSASGSSAGKYLVQYSTARSLPPGLHLCNMAVKIHGNFCKKGFQGVISPPGVYGTLLARFRIENNGTDVAKVHALQNRTSLTCQGGDRPGVQAPSLSPAMMNASLSSQEPTRALQLTARVAPFNPPRNISDLPRVTRMLRAAGIHNGEYQPQVPNLTALGASVKKIVAGISTLPENTMHLQNGWTQLAPQVQGDYGKNYAMRLYVAYSGYLCLRASEALYPMYTPSGNQEVKLTLGPEEAYIVTFSSKPPLATKGFWSLTAYNSQKFLINNPLGRYSVGDRTELTYPDGIPVYGNQSSHDDGSFQVLIQPADTQPPANWTSNWLPIQSGGGDFQLALRFYEPEQALQHGTWEYPMLQKQSAVV